MAEEIIEGTLRPAVHESQDIVGNQSKFVCSLLTFGNFLAPADRYMMKVEMLSLHVLLKNSIVKIRQCFNTTSEVSKNDIHGRILDMLWWISRESYQIPKM